MFLNVAHLQLYSATAHQNTCLIISSHFYNNCLHTWPRATTILWGPVSFSEPPPPDTSPHSPFPYAGLSTGCKEWSKFTEEREKEKERRHQSLCAPLLGYCRLLEIISDFCVCTPSVSVWDVQAAPWPTPLIPLKTILLLISVPAVVRGPHTFTTTALAVERHSFALVLAIFPSPRILSHTDSQRQSPDTYTKVWTLVWK